MWLKLKNLGRSGPMSIWSGRFSPISWVSCFSPTGMGRFGPISKVGRFGPIFGVSCFDLIYFGKTGKLLDWVHPDFALIKVIKVMYLIMMASE